MDGQPAPPSTFVVGAANVLYIQAEDDATVFRMDSSNCNVLDSFAHRGYSEAVDENDQLACDSITYGDGSYYQQHEGDRSVLWIRDTAPNTVSAYWVPDGYCPFPTHVSMQDQTVAAGAPIVVCGVLRKANPSPHTELADETLALSVDHAQIGSSITGSDGRGCAVTTAPTKVGKYEMKAGFGGTKSYLASQGLGMLTVMAAPAPLEAPSITVGGIVQPPSAPGQPLGQAPEPVTAAQAQAAEQAQSQAQAEAQAQAQAQSQTQAQAHTMAQAQPGMMVQAQRRTQVATQEQGTGMQTAYQASALHQTRTPAVGIAVAFMMFGFGLLVRRPRWATARLGRDRRRRLET
jgi:hypothetical protein